jgi:hypothetical protein
MARCGLLEDTFPQIPQLQGMALAGLWLCKMARQVLKVFLAQTERQVLKVLLGSWAFGGESGTLTEGTLSATSCRAAFRCTS